MGSKNRKLSDSILERSQGRLDLSGLLNRQVSPIMFDTKQPLVYYDKPNRTWTVLPEIEQKLKQRNVTVKEFIQFFNIPDLIKKHNYIDTYKDRKIYSTPRSIGEFRAPWKVENTKSNYIVSDLGDENLTQLINYRYEHPWVNQALIKCTDWWVPSLEESLFIYNSYVKKLPPMEWGPDFPLMWTSTEFDAESAYAIEFAEKARVREVILPKKQELTVRLVYAR